MIFKSLLVGIFLQCCASLYAQVPGSREIRLQQADAYGEKVLRVSFDGDDEPLGTFTVTDNSGRVVYAIREAELSHSPNYFSVNIDAFEKGEYTFLIATPKSSYTTRFTIQ